MTKLILARNDVRVLDHLLPGSKVRGKVRKFIIIEVEGDVAQQMAHFQAADLLGSPYIFEDIGKAVVKARDLSR